MRRTRPRITWAALLAAATLTCQAQVQTAGTLLVNIDAVTLPTGPIEWVTNSGTLGGIFQATGLAEVDRPVVTPVGGGTKGILFDGHNFMEHVNGPGGAIVPAPSQLVGPNPPCSIEVWVVNPTFWPDDGETMVAWGARDASMRNLSFNYSANGDHGAVDRWGGNMGWNPVPAAAQWHHLVFTFDGTLTKIYADGVFNRELANSSIDTIAGTPITLASQRNNDGTVTGWGGSRGSLIIGRVRIHSAPLTAQQVTSNYDLEKSSFAFAAAPLAQRPTHRYTFNAAATNDAVGLTIPDVGTAPKDPAVVQGIYGTTSASLNGSRVRLAGGPSDTAPYVDLPNQLISSFSSANGGPGKVTLEGWVNVTGNNAWHRLFDFGSTEVGELTGPATPGPAGQNYFMFAQVNTYRDWHQIEVNNHGFNGGPSVSSARPFGLYNNTASGTGLRHYAVTWDEASGEIVVYENGIFSTRMISASQINQIDDVNAWLGRSNWTGDQNMPGEYDEFRVYGAVLSPAEVQNNYQGGPDAVLVAPGALQTVRLQASRTNLTAGTFVNLVALGDYENVTGLDITARPGIVFSSSNTNAAAVSASGRVVAASPGAAMITVQFEGKTATLNVNVTPVSTTLAHRYSFNGHTGDSVGGPAWAATIVGGASLDGTSLILDGASGYALLPAGMITNQEAVTIETWASFGSPLGNWNELFAFGDRNVAGQGRNYIMMTPHSGNSDIRVSIADGDPGYLNEQVATRGGVLDGRSNVHIAGVYHPLAGYIALYVDGVLAGINTNITIPLSNVSDALGFIGQSIYDGDPYLLGSVDEFRVYHGPLSAAQVAISAAAGPNNVVNDPGALQSVSLTIPTQLVSRVSGPATLSGTFANVANVNLAAFGPTYTSDNTNVATVSASGVITAVAPGTARITASYGGFNASQNLTVVPPAAVLTHRYSFNGNAEDLVGNRDAVLLGTAQIVDGQVVLDAAPGTYVDLGSGLITGYHALTLEAWASFGPNAAWVRLYDLGDQNAAGNGVTSIFFTPHTGGNIGEMTIFVPGRNDHIWPAGMGTLDNVTNIHIVAVYDPLAGYERLFFNGQLVAENRSPQILVTEVNNANSWLGRSLFNADGYLNGSIDEFRVYDGGLSPQQAAINFAAGPNNIVTNLGALQNVRFVVNTNLTVDQQVSAQLLGDFANLAGVNLFAYGNPAVSSSDTGVFTVDASGSIRATGAGQATLTAVFDGQTFTQVLNVAATPLTLAHRYSFNESPAATVAEDTVGDADAVLQPGAEFNGTGQMVLDGTNGFAFLPQGIVSTLTNATFEVWITPTSSGNWQRIFDFGTDEGTGQGRSYVFLSARGAPGARFTVKPLDAGEAPILNSQNPLLVNQPAHMVAVYNWTAGRASLYQNGVLVASGNTVTPLSAIPDVANYLGKSQYTVDALFAGTYDEFRIWDGAMQPAQVAASYATGPAQMPVPKVSAQRVGDQVQLTWPKWGGNFSVQSTTTLGAGGWAPVAGTPVDNGTSYSLTVPATDQGRFFRLVRPQ